MAQSGFSKTGLGGILSYFTRHRTIANLLMVVMISMGFLAATQIRSQFFPDVVIDNVNVSVRWKGAGAEDVDNGIVALMEPALLAVEGVESARSTASEGRASIRLEFEADWDMARAAEDVKTAADTISNLPENAEEIVVRRGAWRDRVTDVIIAGPVEAEQLGRFADEFVARLFREGVTRTNIRGIAAPIVRVTVPESSLVKHDVGLRAVSDAIASEAEADPAGDVAGGATRLRSGTEKRAAEDISGVVIRSNLDGSKLLVSDVAAVTVEGVDRSSAYFVGEDPAVVIRVDRAELGDAIDMTEIVANTAADLQTKLPEGVTITLTNTRADAISDRLNLLFKNGAMGFALVLSLLFLFLNPRTAFWVAAGVPVAMMATIGFMYMAGLTINMISLFALIICLGIVVDDAIVVGEHADFRARRLKEAPVEAAENAAIRMGLPVVSSTLTTVIAFFGLTFISGRFGSLIHDIPYTVVVVLLASLVECFLVLPHHMYKSLSLGGQMRWYEVPSHQFNRLFGAFRDRLFRPAMGWVIRLRYPVVAAMIGALTYVIAMLMTGDVTWRFFNAPEIGRVTGNIAMLPGATRTDTREMVRELQRAVQTVSSEFEAEHGVNPAKSTIAQIGGTGGRGLSGQATKEPDQLGSISVELIDADLRPYSSFAFLGALQQEVRIHPMLETLSFRGGRFGPGGDALDVSLYGASADVLKAASEALKEALIEFPEVSAVEDDMAFDKNELILDLTPQGKALGFTTDGLGTELYQRLNGIDAAEFPVGTRSATIKVSLPDEELTADFLERTYMRSPSGRYVVLSDIVSVRERLGFSQVIRENGLRRINITGDIDEGNPERADEISEALSQVILPDIAGRFGVEFEIGGLSEQENTFLQDALFSLYLCLLGIFGCLAWVFASWTRPIVVMAIIPFGLIGTIYGHFVWGVPLSMFTVVGLIGMTGIIINDSIVLVSTIDEYARTRGMVPAVIDGTCDRLRPVILTTLTTVLGLAPLLYESSQQAQFLKPTVITLVYGLGFGLMLVLLIVPSLIVMQQDVGRLVRSYRRGLRNSRPTGGVRGVLALASLAGLGLVAATAGIRAVTGELWAPVASLAGLAGLGGFWGAMFVLLLGLVIVVIATLLLAGLLIRPGRRAQTPT